MAESLPVPIFNDLSEIYPSREAVLREGQRWNDLSKSFKTAYGDEPAFIIRAPGRVNILGEHIDYSLFPVLPAAIEQDILMALRPRSGTKRVRLANVLLKFKATSFEMTHQPSERGWHVDFVSPKDGGGWDNYLKVALQEGLEEFFKSGVDRNGKEPIGMDLLVSGTVPPGSGLSSSAAFVVASSIVFLVANGLTEGVSKGDVVGMAMASEHRMGLRTGGMDQAASALCVSNAIIHLSFYPSLKPVPLPLPSSLAVCIINSVATHALTTGAPEQYNLRVVECIIATRLLCHAWGLDQTPRLKGKVGDEGRIWLREALDLWEGGKGLSEVELYEKALGEVDRVLGNGYKGTQGWTREDMLAASGMEEAAFRETFLEFLEIRATYFHLHRRLKHALEESLRVSKFSALCRSIEPSSSTSESDPILKQLGDLITQSHASCKDVYECTCDETDQLQQLCLAQGALGARQTGGGWGGAVIALLPVSQVEGFLKRIKGSYEAYKSLTEEGVEQAAFATLPGSGAGIYQIQGSTIS
ncbi:ribosomal protein S5 domain 2-type protein [Kockovaella imperatae]|uniref:Galactokinase n=1 Tax=Kockovaella imperatae TaxID=4999 RepID=A0A1Y1U8A1_9TREE|nr:ribosomal protein S5 domain 2-type protein [Kockovaella imperatae]ORX33774.1 ribosomal protein S5 domain 2-type protein [Kockovaella imperatae]